MAQAGRSLQNWLHVKVCQGHRARDEAGALGFAQPGPVFPRSRYLPSRRLYVATGNQANAQFSPLCAPTQVILESEADPTAVNSARAHRGVAPRLLP